MTFVPEMIAEAEAPDTLEKIVVDIVGGLVPMMLGECSKFDPIREQIAQLVYTIERVVMLPEPADGHIHLLIMELFSLQGRLSDYRSVLWKTQDDRP